MKPIESPETNLFAQLDGRGDALCLSPGLKEKLRERVAHASDLPIGLFLEKELLLRGVCERLEQVSVEGREQWLARFHLADLYLALACLEGKPKAYEVFEQRFKGLLRSVAKRFESPQLPAEDLVQMLYEKLLVGAPGRPPKLNAYSGQGPLESWLRVTAVRTFVDHSRTGAQRKRESAVDEDTLASYLAPGDDPEIRYLKTKYRSAFKEAMKLALSSLTSAERNMLRHQLISGLSVDQVGALYKIHRATAARRMARARASLLQATRKHLSERLEVGDQELGSIIDLIRSRFDVSLQRMLGEKTSAPKEG